jgi:hypothetical protein
MAVPSTTLVRLEAFLTRLRKAETTPYRDRSTVLSTELVFGE